MAAYRGCPDLDLAAGAPDHHAQELHPAPHGAAPAPHGHDPAPSGLCHRPDRCPVGPPWAVAAPRPRRRTTEMREVVNAILYVLRTGCAWHLLPHDFPPPGTVYDYFRQWRRNGTIARIHEALRPVVREASEHDAEPSAASLDSQSAKRAGVGGTTG